MPVLVPFAGALPLSETSDLSALFFLLFFFGMSHSHSGINDSTYTGSVFSYHERPKGKRELTNPTSANNLGNIQIPGLATMIVMI